MHLELTFYHFQKNHPIVNSKHNVLSLIMYPKTLTHSLLEQEHFPI